MEVASATRRRLRRRRRTAGSSGPTSCPPTTPTATLVKLLDLLAADRPPLSDGRRRRCPTIHVAHETVPTPWERKGTVMREIVERAEGRDVVLVDGVKVIDPDGWALVLPDPEEPLTHVWAEAGSDDEARRLAQEYVQRIRQILQLTAARRRRRPASGALEEIRRRRRHIIEKRTHHRHQHR